MKSSKMPKETKVDTSIVNNVITSIKQRKPLIILKRPQIKVTTSTLEKGVVVKQEIKSSQNSAPLSQVSTDANTSTALLTDTRRSVNSLAHINLCQPKSVVKPGIAEINRANIQKIPKVKIVDNNLVVAQNANAQCSTGTIIIDVVNNTSILKVNNVNTENSEEISLSGSDNITDNLKELEETKNKLKSLLFDEQPEMGSIHTETGAEESLNEIEGILNDPLILHINSKYRRPDETDISVHLMERFLSIAALHNDHFYLEKKLHEQKKIITIENNNKEHLKPKKVWRPEEEGFKKCTGHENIHELRDEYAVKLGDRFPSSKAFTEYTYQHAQRWLLYYTIAYSHSVEWAKERGSVGSYEYICTFGRSTKVCKSGYVAKGLRKRKRKMKSDCPSRIILRTMKGRDDLTVVYACHHHNHPLTVELFHAMPHCYRLPSEMKEEMYDLISLDVNLSIIAKHMQALTGLPFNYKTLFNEAQKIRKKKIERQFSADKLKQLMDKIKTLREKYGERRKPQTAEEELPQVVSTQSTQSPVAQKQAKKRPKKLSKTDLMLNSYEELTQCQRVTAKRKKKAATEPSIKNESHITDENKSPNKRSSQKRKPRSQNDHEPDDKRGRLEKCLESMAYDHEVLKSVRELQEAVGCSSADMETLQNEYLITAEDLGIDSIHRSDINCVNVITDDTGVFENYEDNNFDAISPENIQVDDCQQQNTETESLEYENLLKTYLIKKQTSNHNDEQDIEDATHLHTENYKVENATKNETIVLYNEEYCDLNVLLQSMENNDKAVLLQERIMKDVEIQTETIIEDAEIDDLCDDKIIHTDEITYLDSHQRTVVEEYVTKYNIHLYVGQKYFAKYFEKLANDLKINVINLLAKIYDEGGVIKMLSTRCPQKSNTITLQFLEQNTPMRVKNDTLSELERCKAEASIHFNAVRKVTEQLRANMVYVKSVTDEFTQLEKLHYDRYDIMDKKIVKLKKELQLVIENRNKTKQKLNLQKIAYEKKIATLVLMYEKKVKKLKEALELHTATIADMENNKQMKNKHKHKSGNFKFDGVMSSVELRNKKSNDFIIVCDVINEITGMTEVLNRILTSQRNNKIICNDIILVQNKTRIILSKIGNILYNLESGNDKASVEISKNSTNIDEYAKNDATIEYIDDTLNDNIKSLDVGAADEVNSIISHDNLEHTTLDIDEADSIISSHDDQGHSMEVSVDGDDVDSVISRQENLEHSFVYVDICKADSIKRNRHNPDQPNVVSVGISEDSTLSSYSRDPLALDEDEDDRSLKLDVDSGETAKNTTGIRTKSLETMIEEYSSSQSTEKSTSVFNHILQQLVAGNVPSSIKKSDVGLPCLRPLPSSMNWPPRFLPTLTNCKGHDGLRIDNLTVKTGLMFSSHTDFKRHLNNNGKLWFFNYMSLKQSRFDTEFGFFNYTCSYLKNKWNNQGALHPKSKCPCEVILQRVWELDVLLISYVCNHHNHEELPQEKVVESAVTPCP